MPIESLVNVGYLAVHAFHTHLTDNQILPIPRYILYLISETGPMRWIYKLFMDVRELAGEAGPSAVSEDQYRGFNEHGTLGELYV
jgi:hypothetical protein